MSNETPEFGAVARRFLSGELTRAEAAALIFSEFEKARGSNATLGFSIDFGNPELFLAPLKHLRLYRRRRLLRRQVDQFAEILEREMPAGTREFHEQLSARMHAWLREHPPT